MARVKKPKYLMSSFKRSPFDELVKIALIEDFDFDETPDKLDVTRFGVFKQVSKNASYAEYRAPKIPTILRIML